MIIVGSISITLNIILIVFCFLERSTIIKLQKENLRLKRRKIKASEQMIQSFEKAMIAAIDTGNIKQYRKYRDMYNDLISKSSTLS